ncbi:TetR/AcrR family transcriptional regulator [Arthrobacter sp. MSA 4-2]|uniref:TetR/AcrR family transcriptional regulator n=1 Tax=Arthrobacter sp. MSA 4-2 TaxID=2794349 RepID=UPI0018E85F13|nr:TetR/AcrR family transcriptional regulator [Arthrobacter sp. MSA 4-2]MBJ2122617.1 TetR/AcrR family transcriptional regulator [Arthrobacter sp. MSA 4-2]
MTAASQPLGRRERNKQAKLERIVAAASELFAQHGVDDVTTQQIADKADIGTGTLFLYARNKGELLLLVENATYGAALERGRAGAEAAPNVLEAALAIVRPIVECNRAHPGNGRTYLREMIFGDPSEPNHGDALTIIAESEKILTAAVQRDGRFEGEDAATVARTISSVLFFSMAVGTNAPLGVEGVMKDIRRQLAIVLHR